MIIVVICLALISIALIVKVILLRRGMDEMLVQLADKLEADTNAPILISSRDRRALKLANELNARLKQMRDMQLRYLNGDREIKEAITNISHDLRTPLTAISGYIELMEKDRLSPDAARYLDMIKNRAERMRDLTEELFRYSVMSSAPDEATQSVSLNSVLEESVLDAYAALNNRGIEPMIDICEYVVVRDMNRAALSRVFGNILSNAIKYSDGDLSIRLTPDGKVTFTNTSAKLTPVLTGRLFDRFFTVETGRSSTGLGLSIARALTERMGGTVSADYTDGKLCITVSFPE